MKADADQARALHDYDEEIRHEINRTLQVTPPGEWAELALCPGPFGCPRDLGDDSPTEGGFEQFCEGCRIIRSYRPPN